MATDGFTGMLRELDGTAIHAIAGGLDAVARTRDDSERLEVMIDIDRALRSHHLEREGAGAARAARDIVYWAAKRERIEPTEPDVIEVSRTAADLARSFLAETWIGERTLRNVQMWLAVFGFHPADDGLWLPT